MKRLVLLFALIATVAYSYAQMPTFPFKDGTKVCVIGNSITHNGRYHKMVNTFYSTRYPGSDVQFIGCGISGEKAGDMIFRFERDILIHKPDYAILMTGMNDIFGGLYKKGIEVTQSIIDQRKSSIEQYKTRVTKLIGMMQSNGITPILMTPSIYDQTLETSLPAQIGKNDALGVCAEFIREQGRKRNLLVIENYDTMLAINQKIQAVDPKATIIGKDRVHPGDAGHFVMGYNIISKLLPAAPVNTIEIDARKGKVISAQSCVIKDISTKENLSFTVDHSALPMPKIAGYDNASKHIDFDSEYNQEIIKVAKLAKGDYQLRIDGKAIDTLSQDELAKGVNIATNKLSPRYAESMKIANLIEQYSELQGDIRDIAFIEFRLLKDYKGEDSFEQKLEYANNIIESRAGTPYYNSISKRRDTYLELKPKQDSILKEMDILNNTKSDIGAKSYLYEVIKIDNPSN